MGDVSAPARKYHFRQMRFVISTRSTPFFIYENDVTLFYVCFVLIDTGRNIEFVKNLHACKTLCKSND